MSSLIVQICKIDSVRPHPNADALDICVVKGWQCVIAKGSRQAGDKVVYIPPDSIIPLELSERLGVTKYLSNGRVRCAKLRGEPSFGVLMDADGEVGTDMAAALGIRKYEPPVKTTAGDAETDDPRFHGYTEIENLRNFPDVFGDGELVEVSEKIHGTMCAVGSIGGEWMARSKSHRRKRPGDDDLQRNLYWYPFSLDAVRNMIDTVARQHENVILFGETYGKVQSLTYGKPGRIGFAAFDIAVNGMYWDRADFQTRCAEFLVPTVPSLYTGPFSIEKIKELSTGQTVLGDGVHIREGIVMRPLRERTDPRIGRVILKYLNDDYLLKKEAGKVTDSTDE